MSSDGDPVSMLDDQSADTGASAGDTGPAEEAATDDGAPGTEEAHPAAKAEPAEEATAPAEPDEAADPREESDAATVRGGTKPDRGDATDRWDAFAPESVRAPGRLGRWAGRLVRVLRHEWTVVSFLGVLLSIAMTWPSALHATDTLPEDLGDPALVAWVLAWPGHALTHDPTQLWHTNAFFPSRYSFAFTDTMLGYLPASLIGTGWVAAVVRYNVLFILAFALASVGAYALVRQLGATRIAAAVAGVAYAYAPWRHGQSGHLHIMSSGGIVLALAMLARGHGLSLRDGHRRDRVRPGWAVAGWLVAAWQITIGFGIGIVFGYVLAGCLLVGAVAWLLRRWRLPRRLVFADAIGGVIFLVVTACMAYPFLRVKQTYPNVERRVEDLQLFSPPWRGFFVAPPESLLWGTLHAGVRETLPFPPEMAMLPGFALFGLALAGLFISAWSVRARVLLAVGVAVTLLCGVGTNGPRDGKLGYLVLYHLPGFNALRTPGRLVIWTTLLLGILAAGAVTGLARRGSEVRGNRVPGRPEALLRIAMLIPLALVLVEGINKMPHPVVPAPPAGFGQIRGPMVVLPDDGIIDELYMLWSTDGFPKMVNGISGYAPPRQAELRKAGDAFPDPQSVDTLRAAGVRTVVVLRNEANNPALLEAHVDGLGITREERGDLVIYNLTP